VTKLTLPIHSDDAKSLSTEDEKSEKNFNFEDISKSEDISKTEENSKTEKNSENSSQISEKEIISHREYTEHFDDTSSEMFSEEKLLFIADLPIPEKTEPVILTDTKPEPVIPVFKEPVEPVIQPETIETEIKLDGAKTAENLVEKLFGNSIRPKITQEDVRNFDESDLSQTKEISLADSSLVEMLNIYEEKNTRRSEQLNRTTFENVHNPSVTKTRPKTAPMSKTFSKNSPAKPLSKTVSKTQPIPKKPAWTHVKSSGYGPSWNQPKVEKSRPRISPRLTAKVEAAKKARMVKSQPEQKLGAVVKF
jgi:hypothetical protein